LASSNPPDATSRGRHVRAIRKSFPAKGSVSSINDELISAIKAKAEAEVRAVKAEAEAEIRAAKAEAEVRAAKAEAELEKNNLSHILQWRTVALAQLRGRLNMRGLLGALDYLNVGCWCSCYD